MKSIFLRDSDEEAIMEFIKQQQELYDTTNGSFKHKQKKERLWEQIASTRNLPIKTVKKWFETQCSRYGKLTQTKSGQAAEKSTERKDQKEGSFQVFCIQVTPETFCSRSLSLSFSSRYIQEQSLRWKSALHQMLLISLRAPVPSDDSLQSRLPPLLQIQS